MVLLYQEEHSKYWNKKSSVVEKLKIRNTESSVEETTVKCSICKAMFPIEYNECPSCNMFK